MKKKENTHVFFYYMFTENLVLGGVFPPREYFQNQNLYYPLKLAYNLMYKPSKSVCTPSNSKSTVYSQFVHRN